MRKWIDVNLYFRQVPGGDDMHLPYRLDRYTIDEEFERGGLPAVEAFFDMSLGQVFNQLKGELLKPYLEATKKIQEDKGPLGFMADVAITIHEHRTGRSKRDAERGTCRGSCCSACNEGSCDHPECRDLSPDVHL